MSLEFRLQMVFYWQFTKLNWKSKKIIFTYVLYSISNCGKNERIHLQVNMEIEQVELGRIQKLLQQEKNQFFHVELFGRKRESRRFVCVFHEYYRPIKKKIN